MALKWRPKLGQKTEKTPQGLDVPVPTRGEVFANLKKVASKPASAGDARRPKE